MGTLYLVSTPIGNMEDITERAKRILGEVDLIACEDTRKTGMLLARLNLPKKRLLSYYEENELARIPEIIRSLQNNQNIALVSNAGTPVMADPGFKLVRECVDQGIKIVSIPGPSAILTALVGSGLPIDKFIFLGYLPKSQTRRQKILRNFGQLSSTLIFFESPYRLLRSLADVEEVFGDIEVVVCQELTKLFEEVRRGKANDLIKYFETTRPRGEFTVLVGPARKS